MRRTYRRPKPKIDRNIFRINEQIRVPELFVIDEEGTQVGVMPTSEALIQAKEKELDLIEVSPKAQPPVAKIGDYGRIKYQKEKMIHKQSVQQKKTETKAVRLSLRISPHDLELRFKQAEKFLMKGSKLKVEIVLKGREKQLRLKAHEIMTDFVNKLKQNEELNIIFEQVLTRQPNGFNMIVVNKK
jgi:translation initiation factor IF-3